MSSPIPIPTQSNPRSSFSFNLSATASNQANSPPFTFNFRNFASISSHFQTLSIFPFFHFRFNLYSKQALKRLNLCMTSASELFHCRRYRLGRTDADLGLDSEPPDRHLQYQRRHHAHNGNHRRDLNSCGAFRRSSLHERRQSPRFFNPVRKAGFLLLEKLGF